MKNSIFLILILSFIFVCFANNAVLAQTKAAPHKTAAELKLPKGWSSNPYYHWIDRVWDSSVLPDCVPKEIAGVKVESTIYKAKDQASINDSYRSGEMYFDNSSYERWGLAFSGSNAQVQAFLDGFAAKGFFGGQTDDYPLSYGYVGNGYYASLSVNPSWEDKNVQSVQFNITPAGQNALPKSFFGTTLPQVGVALHSYSDWELTAYDKEYNEIKADYNLKTDKGKLPPYYVGFFQNSFVPESDVRAYVKQMQSEGWTVTHQREDSEYGYGAYLKKGDMLAYCHYVPYSYMLELSFSNMEEMLSY